MARMKQKLYESIYFAQGDDAEHALQIFFDEGEHAAMRLLMNWHYPGEHETSDCLSHGGNDYIYQDNGYTLSVNSALGTIGLEYEINQ